MDMVLEMRMETSSLTVVEVGNRQRVRAVLLFKRRRRELQTEGGEILS
jgi:hypothetical protein